MKKFTCHYLKDDLLPDREYPRKKIEASSAEEAAHIFAEQYPSENLRIDVTWGMNGNQVIANPAPEQRENLVEKEIAERASEAPAKHDTPGLRGGVSTGGYSLTVTKKEPMLHSLFTRFGWFALTLIPLAVILSAVDREKWFLGHIPDLCYAAVILLGGAQLIKFLHSIAWNTQEARRERIES